MSESEQMQSKDLALRPCRVCFDTKCLNYIKFDDECNWIQLYEFCLDVSVSLQGSQVLCNKCANLLKSFADFKKQCQKAERMWSSLVANNSQCFIKETYGAIKQEKNDDIWNDGAYNNLNDEYLMKADNDQNEIEIKDESIYSELDTEVFVDEVVDNEVNQPIKIEIKPHITDNIEKPKKIRLCNKPSKKWKCDKCKKKYKNKIWYSSHIQICEGNVKIVPDESGILHCGICDFTSNRLVMNQHLEIHALSNDLNCKICDYIGKDFANMVSHRYTHHPKDVKKKIFCHLCENERFYSLPTLQYHYKTVHLKKNGLECSVCSKTFRTFKVWRNHERAHLVERYVCDICGRKFLFKNLIEAHMQDHSDIDKCICETCGRGFKRVSNLNAHVSKVHVKHTPVKCSHCNKIFKSEFNLQTHLRIENMEKRYVCTVCGKKYPSNIMLKNHMIWHSDERPFACEICGGKYKVKSQLKIHMRQHTGLMPFKCQFCDKAFASSNQLKVHSSVHTGVRRYKCNYCHRTFHTKQLVTAHCASQHKDFEIKYVFNSLR